MKRVFLLSLALCSVFFMIGCKQGKVEAELRSVIERNLKGNQEENMELALMDIDESSKENTKNIMKIIFEQYDLSYRILSFKVISINKDTADVEVVQETKKIKGPAFQDNVATVVHTLKKRSDGWKIVATKIKETKFL